MQAAQADLHWMHAALDLARRAECEGEVPVAAVVVYRGQIIGSGCNRNIARHDPSAHAEIEAMREAGRALGNHRLADCWLYCTLEPCAMCAGAMVHARLARVIYAARDPRAGAAGSVFDLLESPRHNHQIRVWSGVLEDEAQALLQAFFKRRRAATPGLRR